MAFRRSPACERNVPKTILKLEALASLTITLIHPTHNPCVVTSYYHYIAKMDPPERPRRRDQAKEFFKHPGKFLNEHLGSRTPTPSRSRSASRLNVSEDIGTSTKASHNILKPNPPAEGTSHSEIGGHQPNIDVIIGRIPQDPSMQAAQSTSSEAPPSLLAQNEALPSSSTSDEDGALQDPHLLAPSAHLGREVELQVTTHIELPTVQSTFSKATPSLPAQNEALPSSSTSDEDALQDPHLLAPSAHLGRKVEPQVTTHIERPTQDLGTADLEGVLTDKSASLAATTSQVTNKPRPDTPHVEYQPPRLASKIYEGVKTTLRKIVNVSDVFPPLKSTAAGLLVICDTIDVSLSNEIRSSLPIYM
jgi:hypothetical protein